MKPLMHPLTQMLLIAIFLLIGCKDKDLILDKPGNGPKPTPPASHKVLLSVDALPGETTVVNDLFAIISITNGQDQPVLSNHKVTLQHNGRYSTDTITLASGSYKISKFIIVDKNGIPRFATPFSGSQMGSQVQHPLSISFALPKPAVSTIAIDVLRVPAGADPQMWGYPAGAFNLPSSGDPDDNDPNAFTKIKVRPLIKVGDVVYDSIPVAFTLTSWNASGQPTVTNIAFAAGTNEVRLPKSAIRYDLQVNKWGITDVLSLQKEDVQEGALYQLGGSKEAKKLQWELGYKMVNGAWIAESKKVYQYDGSRLAKIIHQRKRSDNSIYVHRTEYFTYNSIGKVVMIVIKGENDAIISETNFNYAQDGKIAGMQQKEGAAQTTAQVSYTSGPGGTGISQA
ncbi:MAG: hypothetical protein ACO1NX_10390, partial [Chitinophagaceae bacterium]